MDWNCLMPVASQMAAMSITAASSMLKAKPNSFSTSSSAKNDGCNTKYAERAIASGANTIAEMDIPIMIFLSSCMVSIKPSIRPRILPRAESRSASLICYHSLYGYISLHLWVQCAVVLKGTGLVCKKGDGLAFKVTQVSSVHVECIDVKVVF